MTVGSQEELHLRGKPVGWEGGWVVGRGGVRGSHGGVDVREDRLVGLQHVSQLIFLALRLLLRYSTPLPGVV